MASVQQSPVLRHLRELRNTGALAAASDAELLRGFLVRHEEAAFAVLVRRHGPMVLGVSRRVLRQAQDAEDVFQATFLLLARKAGSIRKPESVGGWLHGVAHRLALRTRTQDSRRQARERRAAEQRAPRADSAAALQDVQAALDAALEELPEKYRTALVLCCLEGKTLAEAGRQLDCCPATVGTRVARGRDLLRRRLARQGLALSAAGLAALLSARAAPAAAPAALVRAVVQAAVPSAAGQMALCSPRVAALVKEGLRALVLARLKTVAAVLVLAGVVAGAAVLAHGGGGEPRAQAEPPPAKESEKPPAAPAGAVEVTGRVLGPDGRPVAGAGLFWPRLLKANPEDEEDIRWERRATSDAEGRFRLKLAGKDFLPEESGTPLVAAAAGFGPGSADVAKDGKPAELTLRLGKEQVIEGRLLDTQGKPRAGVRVTVYTQATTAGSTLDPFLKGWKREWQDALRLLTRNAYALASAKSDKDGRFRLTGAGAERVVSLALRGNGVPSTTLYVVTRPGFDPKPYNDAALDRIPPELRIPGQPPLLYGPSFQYVATPARVVEGAVRDVNTGKPLAGVRVQASTGYGTGVQAVSDAQGRYRLAGLPKAKEYSLYAMPPKDGPLLAREVRAPDTGGLGPVPLDIGLARGIVVTGRVLDRATGKGLQGGIRFAPLQDNTFFKKPGYDSYRFERLTTPVDADGRFRLVVIPGPGVLMAQVYGGNLKIDGQVLSPYRHAELTPADRERIKVTENNENRFFTAADGNLEFLTNENAIKVLDLKEGASPVTCDLYVESGKTLQVRVEDADGKPLPGAVVSGLTESGPIAFRLKAAECTVYALDAKKPRTLVFFHPGQKLAGRLTVRGDEKAPPAVRLVPAGAVTGRLLDADGQAVAGAEVDLSHDAVIVRELYRELAQGHEPVRTDRDGRFRLEAVVPDLPFGLAIHWGHTYLASEPRIGTIRVGPGKTLDLGDRRVKPAR